jgi:hypothetical protein
MNVPVRPCDITAETFNALTGRTDVTDVRVVGEDHGTAVRARLDVTGSSAGEPTRVFAKLTPTQPMERLFNNLMRLGHNEVEVYRRLGAELRDVMPAVYGAASDPRRRRSVVLMEDLTLRDAQFGDVAGSCTRDQAVAVARTLAGFHAKFWESDLFASELACFTPPAARSVSWGPQTSRLLVLLPRRYHDVVPREVRADARILRTRRRDVADVLRDFPLTFLHGDTHRGNLCFVGDQPILFDWQVAAQGPGLKDLAYFAVTSLDPDIRRAIERELITEYLDALASSGGPRLPSSQAWDDYRMLAVTAYTAAAVTAAFSGRLQGDDVTRAGLDRGAQAVTDLESFAELRRRIDAS